MSEAFHTGLGMVYGAILVKAYGFRIRYVLASAVMVVLIDWSSWKKIKPAVDRWRHR